MKIGELVEKYLNIITSNNFNYEEALYVLDMRIDDEEKVKQAVLHFKENYHIIEEKPTKPPQTAAS